MKKGKSSAKYVWMSLEHREILYLYNAVIRGFMQYYSFVINFDLMISFLIQILKSSCAKLLAAKYFLNTQAKVFAKFGKDLISKSNNNNVMDASFIRVHPNYKNTLSYLVKMNYSPRVKALYVSKSLASIDNLYCFLCQSDYRVVLFQVRSMKELNLKFSLTDKFMVKYKRKELAICRECLKKNHRR